MRSFTDTAWAMAMLAEWPTSGMGDCRKARESRAAPSTSANRGAKAGISRPATMPAIEACNPELTVAHHTTSVTRANGQVRQTPIRPSTASTTTPTAATSSAGTSRSSE